ncbi:MAG: hypothetical protein R2813_13840 [Flavobacteriales bacterium]
MNKLIAIALLLLFSTQTMAQDTASNSLGNVIDRFYKALSESDSAKRATILGEIMAPGADITSVIHNNGYASATKGSVTQFMSNTRNFYRDFRVSYAEIEREAEYYLDLASVHGICTQNLNELATQKHYSQDLWMQLDCAFVGIEWKIVSATWTNQFGQYSIDNALLQDTLWHMEK